MEDKNCRIKKTDTAPSPPWKVPQSAAHQVTRVPSILPSKFHPVDWIFIHFSFLHPAIQKYPFLLSSSPPSMLFKISSPCLLRFPVRNKEVPPKAASHIFPALLSLREPCFRTVPRSERKKEAEEIKIRPCRIFRTGIL